MQSIMLNELNRMAKYAIISDIHSNIHALEAVLEDINKHNIMNIICLGDVIGYCTYPIECIQRLIEINVQFILGNHDLAASSIQELQYMNNPALKAMEWTIKQLPKEKVDWLARLPLKLTNDNATFVHASPENPSAFPYIIDIRDAVLQFDYFATEYCFFGHTHLPVIFKEDLGEIHAISFTEYIKKPGERLLVNVGSVGQPRDGDKRACWVLFDTAAGLICLQRVEYDYTSAAKAIRESGLPVFLSERILKGV
jgi:diadenosine tetraphosphatase ApaH/serine/threonine PP2A family protein phosphatase